MRRNRQKYKLYLEPHSEAKIPRQTLCRHDSEGVDVNEEDNQTANETGRLPSSHPVGLSRLLEWIWLLKKKENFSKYDGGHSGMSDLLTND